jgi:hypothetical protein
MSAAPRPVFTPDETLLPPGLGELAARHAAAYQSAAPFPHIVLDGVLAPSVVATAAAAFPGPHEPFWHRFANANEVKLATTHEAQLPPYLRRLVHELNSGVFVEFLERLTGIKGLVPDPHLAGGGLHQILPGGKLAVHVDFNVHPRLHLDRRLNLLLYLNDDWREDYGGHLELWDAEMKRRGQRILPLMNRMVVFNTTDFSYHGHPEPLTCPPGRARRSLALYYYSNGRPAAERSARHSTTFRGRPGEHVQRSGIDWVTRLTPPFLMDFFRGFRR